MTPKSHPGTDYITFGLLQFTFPQVWVNMITDGPECSSDTSTHTRKHKHAICVGSLSVPEFSLRVLRLLMDRLLITSQILSKLIKPQSLQSLLIRLFYTPQGSALNRKGIKQLLLHICGTNYHFKLLQSLPLSPIKRPPVLSGFFTPLNTSFLLSISLCLSSDV